MTATYATRGSCGQFSVDVWRAAPEGEFVDGVLVTRMDHPEGEVLRVAVFDPAENLTLPHYRHLAHTGVAVAIGSFSAAVDAVDAANAANAELHDPALTNCMNNPLVTAVWADIRMSRTGVLQVVSAGRAGDGEVAVLRSDGSLELLCSVPMWGPAAGEAWGAWVQQHRPDPVELWAARAQWVGRREQYLNPPLGQFADIAPEVIDSAAVLLAPGDSIVVATDGAELERAPAEAFGDLGAYLATVTARTPTPDANIAGMYSFSDIAAIQVGASPT